MKVKLCFEKRYTTRDRDNKDVIIRTIEAEREIEFPTEFLPTSLKIGGQDFFSEENFYDVDHGYWVLRVGTAYHLDELSQAEEMIASLKNAGWKIVRDKQNIEVVTFAMTRSDAIALIDVAQEGLHTRDPKFLQRPRWNENKTLSTFELRDKIRRICLQASSGKVM